MQVHSDGSCYSDQPTFVSQAACSHSRLTQTPPDCALYALHQIGLTSASHVHLDSVLLWLHFADPKLSPKEIQIWG